MLHFVFNLGYGYARFNVKNTKKLLLVLIYFRFMVFRNQVNKNFKVCYCTLFTS